MNNWIQEVKSAGSEMRKALEVDLMLRRYQKSLNGEISIDDMILNGWIKGRTVIVQKWRHLIKRAMDFIAAAAGLIVVSPLMAVIAIVVKLDSKGPALYSQVRVGENGKFFKMFKFRTMVQDAEKGSGPVWAKQNDSRITRIGDFLRKTHLDELPQLFNVLCGQMSLVGPRPERPFFVDEFKKSIPQYEQRLNAKPGITGLAQIKRRYDETLQDVKNKVRYDRFYIKKMCPFLDAKVLVLTVGTMVFKTGR